MRTRWVSTTVVAVVGRDGGLGEALGLVVDRARADGVDVAPVGLDLGMDLGIAVALGGGGVQVAGVVLAREVERVDGAGGADEQGLDAEAGVVDGAGGRGEVEDEVDGAGVEGRADVLLEEAEARIRWRDGRGSPVAGAEVIDADDGVAVGEESVGEVRAEEAGGSGNEDGLTHVAFLSRAGLMAAVKARMRRRRWDGDRSYGRDASRVLTLQREAKTRPAGWVRTAKRRRTSPVPDRTAGRPMLR